MRSVVKRVLGFVLVVVSLMGVVGLAASQTFINKTGKTVTGIKIEFSKKVTINRHDSAFPDQDPNGRAQEFTFSGRDLRNFGKFSVSWMPSSGKVVDYEWIEKSQPSQTAQASSPSSEQEFKLPDPNTPPILYGNDYPDLDESLYQLQPDEQIWMTDLDGHGDIYDNDSIKINYAPGFDKSQITKIDVYRNGIKLRFLPEKFDVLTNAQMKTFDGNPAEHSPASNHTDHAIMGYEYKFEIHTADHIWMFSKTVKSGFKWRPEEVFAQMDNNWTESFSRLSYDDLVRFFQQLKNDGFTGIGFEMSYYMDSPCDNSLIDLKTRNPKISIWGSRTPTMDELETMLKAINAVGLDAYLREYIYISAEYQNQRGFTYSADIKPTHPEKFFDNYTNLLLKIVPLLNEYHVKLITPFVETTGIEQYPDLIKRMYTTISEAYQGEIGFKEETANTLNGYNATNPIRTEEEYAKFERDFTFWNWRDSYGRSMTIEHSCWTPVLDSQKDQRVSVMVQNFVKFWKPAVNYFRSNFPENPQMFGEIGIYNADGVCLGPTYWNLTNKQFDNQEVADIWYTYLKGAKQLGINKIST